MVIAFARRYRADFFFRTEINIIILQVAFAGLILVAAAFTIAYLYRDITTNLIEAIGTILSSPTPTFSAADIVARLEESRRQDLEIAALVILAITSAFGYLVAKVTLAPTRNALSAQKQFIGNVAHELRTPLSTIKTNTEVRLMDAHVPEAGRRVHEQNLEELDRISDIINNLLSMSAFLQPEKMDFKNVDLGEVIEHSIHHLTALARKKSLRISVRKSEYRIVRGNASAVEQILTNLLKNAINFTRPRGHIDVRVMPNYRGGIDLIVEDTGIGIKKQDLNRIFEPFFRPDYSRNRAEGGSGLGLAIVSELVKIHGGRISVRSAPGRGTTVTVALPIGTNVPPPPVQGELGFAESGEIVMDFGDTTS